MKVITEGARRNKQRLLVVKHTRIVFTISTGHVILRATMGITDDTNDYLYQHPRVIQPLDLIGRRYVVPDDYVPRVPSQLAVERLESQGRVQYISRFVVGHEMSFRQKIRNDMDAAMAKKANKTSETPSKDNTR